MDAEKRRAKYFIQNVQYLAKKDLCLLSGYLYNACYVLRKNHSEKKKAFTLNA